MIDIRCSQCGRSGQVPEKYQGRSVKCGKCGTSIPVAAPPASKRWLLLVPIYLLLLGGAGTGAYFIIAPRLVSKETPSASEPIAAVPETRPKVDPPSVREKQAREETERAARKKAEEEMARQRAEAEKIEARRRQEEEAKKALEAKLERERQEKERAEAARQAKEEQARLLLERRNPKLTAQPEDVDRAPETFYGKRLYLDRVKFKEGGSIDKVKDLKRFTIGIISFKGKYFSKVPFSGLFFSVPDKLAAILIEKSVDWETANYLRVYCEIDKCQRPSGKVLPEGRIFKVEVYGKTGNLLHTWEEPE